MYNPNEFIHVWTGAVPKGRFFSSSVVFFELNRFYTYKQNHIFIGLDVFETETGTEIKLGAEFPVFPHKLTAVITTEDSVEYSPVMFMNRYVMHYFDFY